MKCEEDESAAGLAAGCWEPAVTENFEPLRIPRAFGL